MSRRHSYLGACHCGNLEVRFESDKTPPELGLRADGCSFCAKHHALYTSDPGGELHLVVRDARLLERYRFGTKTADFLLCKRCGIFVAAYMPEAAVAVVNVNVLDARAAFLASPPQVLDVDGEAVAQRVARRMARWTPMKESMTPPIENASLENAWLRIPARDYEAHMTEIGQAAALRAIFARVYADVRPRRMLVLGCTTGRDLALLDPDVTTTAVGVDVNPAYLALAREELARLGRTVELVPGDCLEVDLPSSAFDLVYAALLVEYVDPTALFQRIAAWLAPGGVCAVVSQNPEEGVAAVSKTDYDSLHVLDGRMSLVSPEQLVAFAAPPELARTSLRTVPLPGEKTFSVSTFRRAR